MRKLILILAALPAFATDVWLRSGGDGFMISGVTRANPAVVSTCRYLDNQTYWRDPSNASLCTPTAHGLSAGQTVILYNVAGTTSANGIRKVKQVLSATTFSITDLSDVDVDTTGDSPWSDSGSWSMVGRVSQYALRTGPKGLLDGWDGYKTRHFATTTANGLVSVAVSSNVATVTLSYDHDRKTGDYVCIYNSGVTGLDCAIPSGYYTITSAADLRHFTFATSGVAPGTYTDSGMRVSMWATGKSTAWTDSWTRTAAVVSDPNRTAWGTWMGNGGKMIYLSLGCFVTGRSDFCAELTRVLQIPSEQNGGNYACYAAGGICGASQPNSWYHEKIGWGQAYGIAAAMNLLTSGQKTAFLDQWYNDVGDASPCTVQVPTALGTVTVSGTTITGTSGQLWLTGTADQRLHDGDSLYGGANGANGGRWFGVWRVVGEPTSDTTLNVNHTGFPAGALYHAHHWAPGDCGQDFYDASFGYDAGLPGITHYGGSYRLAFSGTNLSNWNMQYHMFVDLNAAGDDPRALWRLQVRAAIYHDVYLPIQLTAHSGFNNYGSRYGPSLAGWISNTADAIAHSFVSAPNWGVVPDATTGHAEFTWGMAMLSMYADVGTTAAGSVMYQRWGAGQSNVSDPGLPLSGVRLWRGSNESKWYADWLRRRLGYGSSYYGGVDWEWMWIPNVEVNAETSDYTAQPKQRIFRTPVGLATCQALGMSAFPCNPNHTLFGWFSRSAWTGADQTLVGVHAMDYYMDRSTTAWGQYAITKRNHFLVATDAQKPNSVGEANWGSTRNSLVTLISTKRLAEWGTAPDTASQRGFYWGVAHDNNHWADTEILRWAGDSVTGPANSEYAYSLIESKGVYMVGSNDFDHMPTRVQRHIAHLKKSGTEELLVVYDDVATPDNAIMRGAVHYPQNGRSADYGVYEDTAHGLGAEGTTTCPGSSDCSALNTTRTILSQATDATVITKYFDPTATGTRFFVLTGTQNGVAGQVGGYLGGYGETFAAFYCPTTDGGSTCNTSATALEAVTVHKIVDGTADTTLTATALNPDANWTGVETPDKVVLFARHGATPSGVSFTAANSGTRLVAGLAPNKTYDVYRGGSLVLSAQPVAAGDGTLYFSGTSGSYSITEAGNIPPAIATASPLPAGAVGVPYSQTLTATGVSPFTWAVTSGSPPAGLNLSSAGILSGTPTVAVSGATFTVTVTDANSATDSKVFALTITGTALGITTTTLYNSVVSSAYSQALAAQGGYPPYTWDITAGALPGGLSLASNGTISGTATAPTGPFTFTARVTDSGISTGTKQLTITNDPEVLAVTTASLAGCTIGGAYSETLAASGGTAPYVWSDAAPSPPAHIFPTVDIGSAGTLIGTCAALGTHTLHLKVTDATAAMAYRDLTVTVSPGPRMYSGRVNVQGVVR